METRANYVAIGAFVLVVIIGALSSLYWLYRSSDTGATEIVRIIFPEPVTGLSSGGAVLFNGIKVGEVTSLEFPQGGGDNVIAMTKLSPKAPIKTDTVAKLGFQGLTGIAYISMTGGSRNAKSLFEATADHRIPTIVADTSAFTNVLDTAQSVLARMNSTLDEVNGILRDNRDDVNVIVTNVRTLSQSFANSAPQIEGLITDIAGAASAIAAAVPQVTRVFDTADNLLSAIEPDRVRSIVANVENFTGELPAIGEQASQIVGNVNGLVTRLDDAAGTLGDAIRAAGDVVASVNRDEIAAIVSNIKAATDTFATRSGEIGTLIDNVSVISTDVREVTAVVAQRKDAIGSALDNATSLITDVKGAVNAAVPAIENLGNAIAAVTPARITAVVDDIEKFTSTLANQSDGIAALVSSATDAATSINDVATALAQKRPVIDKALDDAGALVANLSEASAQVPGIIEEARATVASAKAVVAAVDATAINKVVSDAGTFATALAEQSGRFAGIVTNVEGVATHAQSIAAAIDAKMPAISTIIDNADATAASAKAFADRLPEMANTLQPGIENLANVLAAIDPEAVQGAVTEAAGFVKSLAAQAEPIASIVASVQSAAADVEAVTQTIAQHTPDIDAILTNANQASVRIAAASETVATLASDAAPAVRQLVAAVQVITPERVDTLTKNIEQLVAGISAHTADIEALITDARATGEAAKAIATSIQVQLPQIEAAIGDTRATLASARTFADALPGFTDQLKPAIDNISAVLSSIDPAAIDGIVTDVRTFTTTLSAEAPKVSEIIARIDSSTTDAQAILSGVRAQMGTVTQGLADAGAALADARTFAAGLPQMVTDLQPGIANLSDTLQSIDPAAIDGIITNLKDVTDTVSSLRGDITQVVTTAGSAARNIDSVAAAVSARTEAIGSAIENVASFTANLADVGPQLSDILEKAGDAATTIRNTVAAIDAAQVNSILGNVQKAAAAVGSRSGEIGEAIDKAAAAAKSLADGLSGVNGEDGAIKEVIEKARRIATNLEVASAKIDGVVDKAGSLLDGPVQGLVADVSQAAVSVRDVAAAFASRAQQIAGGLARFSQGGLDDLRALIDQGRSTLSSIERAVSSFDRNPSRVIFGGSEGPRYSPQRR